MMVLLSIQCGAGPETSCFPPEAALDALQTEWLCKQLEAGGESRLAGDPAYRFAYIPSFHPTRIVVAYLENDMPMVRGTVLSGQGGYEPGRIARTTKRTLTAEEWKLFERQLQDGGIWEPQNPDDRLGLDGARWIFEGRKNGRYQFHNVWSPSESDFPKYRETCEYMLELAGIKPEPEELY